MGQLAPEIRWLIVTALLGLAGTIITLFRSRPALLVLSFLLAPLPALLFLRATRPIFYGQQVNEDDIGFLFSATICYASPLLGFFTLFLMENNIFKIK